MSMSTEEKLDRLKDFILQQTQADAVEVLQFKPLSGGATQENDGLAVRLTGGTLLGEHHFVVRSDAPSSLSASLRRSQEFAILQATWQAGVRVPRPWWLCTDRSLMGGEFYAMDWAAGSAAGRRLTGDDLFTPQSRKALVFDLGRELGQLTAILDWEFASWSDPYEDLGWMCSRSWRFGHPEREVGGVGDKADFFAGYESVTGRAVDPQRVAYWEVMASVRWAVIALGQRQRHLSGKEASLELALTGRMLPEIQQDMMIHLRNFLTQAGEQPPAYTAMRLPGPAGSTGKPLAAASADLSGNPSTFADTIDTPTGPGDLPDGAELLKTARDTLLQQILPAVGSEQRYNTRMIANAMAIARRELESESATRQRESELLLGFYDTPIHAPTPTLHQLANDIR